MKKIEKLILTIAIIFFSSSSSYSQNDTLNNELQKSNFLLGIYYSPDINFYNPNNQIYFSTTYGVNSELVVNKRISLTLGVMYSYRDYQPNTVAYGIFIRQTENLLEMPFNIKYEFLNKDYKMKPFISTGLTPVIKFYGEDTYTDYDGENERIYIRNGISVEDILLNFSLGIDYTISEKLNISFQPTLRLTPTKKISGRKLSNSILVEKAGLGTILFFKF